MLSVLIFLDLSGARKEPQKTIRTVQTNGNDEVDVVIENTSVTDRSVCDVKYTNQNCLFRCYQYTWVGVEKESNNGTGSSYTSCMDLESDVSVP